MATGRAALHYPPFLAAREATGRPLPKHVRDEFQAYLKCGRLEYGFLRVKCEQCRAEKILAFSCKGRALCLQQPRRGRLAAATPSCVGIGAFVGWRRQLSHERRSTD